MYIFEIAGIVVTVVFIIYFLFVRDELKTNNETIARLRQELDKLNADLSESVVKLFNEKLIMYNWDDGKETEEHVKTQFQLAIEGSLKPLINESINGERFVDNVVERINKKQVG